HSFLRLPTLLSMHTIPPDNYARTVRRGAQTQLLRGVDLGKDQTYFLAAVPANALARTLFPLGELHKSEVRAIARRNGLGVYHKPDSTGVCFIGERDFEGFLRSHIAGSAGTIRVSGGALNGQTIGRHSGLIYYTIGQRKGLGLGGVRGAADAPWFVAAKDMDTNTLWVTQDGSHPALMQTTLTTLAPQWITAAPDLPLHCSAQVRYRQRAIACVVTPAPTGGLQVQFEQPPRAIAAGQYTVFYDGSTCLGGAEIAHAGATEA